MFQHRDAVLSAEEICEPLNICGSNISHPEVLEVWEYAPTRSALVEFSCGLPISGEQIPLPFVTIIPENWLTQQEREIPRSWVSASLAGFGVRHSWTSRSTDQRLLSGGTLRILPLLMMGSKYRATQTRGRLPRATM